MKKLILFSLIAIVGLTGNAKGQESNKHTAVQLSFVPPLSTNGFQAYQYTNDVSFNILAGISRSERGFALGSIANIITDESKGFQLAGIANVVGGNGSGFMFAGVVNHVKDYSGLQLAGVTNIAGNIKGVQFAGVINRAVNVKGTQIGVINIAESNDYPVGLVNIIRNGEMGISVTYNETGENIYSFRSGGKYLYGIIGIGFNHKVKGGKFLTEAGLGGHIPLMEKWRINSELKTSATWRSSDKELYHHSFAILPAYKLCRNIELFGGPSLNFLHTKSEENREAFPGHSLWKKMNAESLMQLYIGYQVGIHFIF